VGDLEAHKSPGDVDGDLDDTALHNLREWYAGDYEFLALCQAQAPEINRTTL
jgi:hypothetical protein